MRKKMQNLKKLISRYRSAVIAFSGGTDSTFLASVAAEALPKRVLLVTASFPSYPRAELQQAKSLARQLGLPHRVIAFKQTALAVFAGNPPDRCYLCKRGLFSMIIAFARKKGYEAVFDGSNADDAKDYRPGRKALKELGVISPLCEVKLTKKEIRLLSAERRLATADKPSAACLASRFPYGEQITERKLQRVDNAETALRKLGFRLFRVRSHGNCARIETDKTELVKAWNKRSAISSACRNAGFIFVAIDTEGYRTGAMNETLNPRKGL